MRVKKILNNCVILAENDQHQEMIVMGNAIGYHYKVNDEIEETKIDRTFVQLDHQWNKEFLQLLSNTSQANLELTNEIIAYGKTQLSTPLSDAIYITLMDHINFIFKRYEEQMKTQNRLYWDVKRLYPKEFHIGVHALALIEEKTGIALWEEEAANIALHFVNAENDGRGMETTMEVTQTVRHILQIITYHFQKDLDENSISFSRLVTHLQFFVYRMLEHKILQDGDDFLYQQVKIKYPKEFECVARIEDYTLQQLHTSLTHDEITYLCIHIHRVYQTEDAS